MLCYLLRNTSENRSLLYILIRYCFFIMYFYISRFSEPNHKDWVDFILKSNRILLTKIELLWPWKLTIPPQRALRLLLPSAAAHLPSFSSTTSFYSFTSPLFPLLFIILPLHPSISHLSRIPPLWSGTRQTTGTKKERWNTYVLKSVRAMRNASPVVPPIEMFAEQHCTFTPEITMHKGRK